MAIKNIKTFSKVSLYFFNFYFKIFIVKTANVRRQQLLNHYTEEYCVALVIFRFIYLRYVTFHLKRFQPIACTFMVTSYFQPVETTTARKLFAHAILVKKTLCNKRKDRHASYCSSPCTGI